MRKIALYMMVTLDGFVSGPNDEFDDFEPSAEEHAFANQHFGSVDSVIFGRKTYEGFAAYWDALDPSNGGVPAAEAEFAGIFQRLERVVCSRTLAPGAKNTLVLKHDIPAALGQLKRMDKRDMLLVCGPELLADLLAHGLVDELLLMIKPRVLGRGRPLFGALAQKATFSLLRTREFASGTVLHHYTTGPIDR